MELHNLASLTQNLNVTRLFRGVALALGFDPDFNSGWPALGSIAGSLPSLRCPGFVSLRILVVPPMTIHRGITFATARRPVTFGAMIMMLIHSALSTNAMTPATASPCQRPCICLLSSSGTLPLDPRGDFGPEILQSLRAHEQADMAPRNQLLDDLLLWSSKL